MAPFSRSPRAVCHWSILSPALAVVYTYSSNYRNGGGRLKSSMDYCLFIRRDCLGSPSDWRMVGACEKFPVPSGVCHNGMTNSLRWIQSA
jgi:hypothetical protein